MEEVIQLTQFYKMHGIFSTENMSSVNMLIWKFRGLILAAHKLTPQVFLLFSYL